MNVPLASIRRRPGSVRASHRAFTLIELLAVMVIILILAGLILNIAGNAQYKAALSRANAEIKQMETACESYKVDNGTYPRDNATNNYTDNLNAQTATDPNASTAPTYSNASAYLFQQLSGITFTSGSTTPTLTKAYITFLPGQISTGSATPTSSTYIIDPFGFSYGYSTANQLAQDNANSTTPATAVDTTKGYNPTFDLWSTAGYSPTGGKSYPTTIPNGSTAAAFYSTLWAKNW